MRFVLFFIILICSFNFSIAQSKIEKKILIQDGMFYFMTFDEISGMSTLHMGHVSNSIHQSQNYILPWSRHTESPEQVLMWDIIKDSFTCVNTIRHSQNDPFQNIKRVGLQQLDSLVLFAENKDLFILNGIDQNNYIRNVAHEFVLKEHKFLDSYYSDLALGVDGDLYILNHVEGKWRLQKGNEIFNVQLAQNITVENQPNLVRVQEKFVVLIGENVFELLLGATKELVFLQKIKTKLDDCILIINRDENTLSYMNSSFFDSNNSLAELIKLYSVSVY